MTNDSLRRLYLFSDTYGRSKNPFLQDDADAIVSTDFRSFPNSPIRREFDIYGRETLTAHMLRMIFSLHEKTRNAEYLPVAVREEFDRTCTGIFINAAPRVGKDNGYPFYVATSKNIRIVTTDLSALSTVKDQIETLAYLNNEDNKIYSRTEQFRSSYTPYLLHPDCDIKLIEDSLDKIPDYPDDKWELAYVDRFGNLVTYTNNPQQKWDEVLKASKELGGEVKLIIGNVSQRVYIGSSLRDAEPDSLVMYMNDDIDVLRKWEAEEDSYTRLYKSAYFQFAKPEIGAKVRARV
jgi:hypothetical protein